MNKGRKSFGVFLGRLFQSIPPLLYAWIEVFLKKKEISKYPIIFLISMPRSGSTLTYQILSRGTKSYILTNLWNILYAIPLIGAFVSQRKKNNNTDLIFTDLNSENKKINLNLLTSNPTCIIIGPEGDFSEKEREEILKYKGVQPIKINENILRSETAVISAISIINYVIN